MPLAALTHIGPNIGDDIQQYAASRFLPHIDYRVNREAISQADIPPGTKIILNGWFMHKPHFWPPSPNLTPLFISFHARRPKAAHPGEWLCDHLLGSETHKQLIAPQYFDYFKMFQPIGCRDLDTRDRFRAIGIEAEFSGCLTLTLKLENLAPRGNTVVFTDPFGTLPGTCFRRDLWWQLPGELRKRSKKFTHLAFSRSRELRQERVKYLLTQYATAGLVITSRLHAALPSVALGTKVILLSTSHRDYRFLGYESILQPVTSEQFLRAAKANDLESLISKPDRALVDKLAAGLRQRCESFTAE